MRNVTSRIEIESGPEPVWRLLSEPERYPDYVPATQRLLSTTDPTVRVGTVYREYGGLPPFLGESEWTVTELEAMEHQRHVGDDGQVRMLLDLDVARVADERSSLTVSLTIEPRWFLVAPMLLLWPLLMRRRAQEVVDGVVANAKAIVEQSPRRSEAP